MSYIFRKNKLLIETRRYENMKLAFQQQQQLQLRLFSSKQNPKLQILNATISYYCL